MDYLELYEAWKREKKSSALQDLDKKFYVNLSQYMKSLREDSETLDEKAMRGRLMARECNNVKKLLTSLVECRYRKILKAASEREPIPPELLTNEEEVFYNGIISSREKVDTVLRNALRGRIQDTDETRVIEKPKRILVRFLQGIPTIVGQDMRVYGPFKVEDVATLPAGNAEILIKRGVAIEVEAR